MKDVNFTKTSRTSASRTSAKSTYLKESAIRGKQEKDKDKEEEEERGVRLSFFLDDKILRIMCLLSTACTTKKRSIREAMAH